MAAQTTIEKMPLSGSTDGRPVAIAATADPGTTLHTAGSGIDIVYLQLWNTDTSARLVTIEHGSNGTSDLLQVNVPPQSGPVEIPPLLIRNSLVVKAYCASANKVNVSGYVERLA